MNEIVTVDKEEICLHHQSDFLSSMFLFAGFEVSKRRFHSACEDALYKGETAKHEFIKAVVSVTSINMVRLVSSS